jgi:adenylate cyclase
MDEGASDHTPPRDVDRDDLAEFMNELVGVESGRYTRNEAVAEAGVDLEDGRRFWRAMGFPEVPDDERVFTDQDVEMLRGVHDLMTRGTADMETALQITRVTGQCAARLAETYMGVLWRRTGVSPSSVQELDRDAIEATASVAQDAIPFLRESLLYMWRRHLSAAVKRTVLSSAGDPEVSRAVGFADLAAFSRLTEELDEFDLAEIVTRFETLSFDTVAEFGGRVVKLIGDEIMFVAPEAAAAATIGVNLVERCESDDVLPSVHVGIAYGPVLDLQGDVFGSTVNLASRVTGFARPATVVASRGLKEAADGAPDIEFRPLRRPVRLKGLGKERLYTVRTAGSP